MARRRIPSYRLHKASGQAVVVLGGVSHYLGVYGTPESRARYDLAIAEWLARSRTPEVRPGPDLTVSEVLAAYLASIQGRYCHQQRDRITRSLALVRRLYGDSLARDFRGRALKAVRVEMVREGLVRRHINHRVGCIKQCFRWALSEELVPGEAVQSLLAVAGLRKGESDAPESRKIEPVALEVIEATLPHLHPVLADLVRVQLYSGMRPGEVVRLRGEEIDRARPDLWVWRPTRHKTAGRGHSRQIYLGPKAIEIVAKYPDEGYLFSPRAVARDSRGKRRPGERYTPSSYSHAVARACERAGVEHWHPHQLRHTAGTLIAQEYGWELARIYLGHRSLDTTRIYAEDHLDRVAEAVRKMG